ncbi:putative permease of ABC transporter, partial [Vibrio parahaemolyticus VP2007-007]
SKSHWRFYCFIPLLMR